MVLLKIMSYFGAKFDFEAKIFFFLKSSIRANLFFFEIGRKFFFRLRRESRNLLDL